MDVFCCTASILNIVVIAVDRYWLITRNLSYTHSTCLPRRTVCTLLLTAAWLVSALIASAPLLGWPTDTVERGNPSSCAISQDYIYTILSTFGAFWFPLSVILIVYARIFRFARLRANRRHGSVSTTTTTKSRSEHTTVMAVETKGTNDRQEQTKKKLSGMAASGMLLPKATKSQLDMNMSRFQITDTTSGVLREQRKSLHLTSTSVTTVNLPSLTARSSIEQQKLTVTLSTTKQQQFLSVTSVVNAKDVVTRASESVQLRRKCRTRRMRRSARTLGLVIGGFVMCWLPFFVIATLAPFCPQCYVPKVLRSFVLWLGYCNSLINPAIYAIWDKSFRRSFKRICTFNQLR